MTSVKSSNKPKGNFIETQATAYLCREGYEIVARNYAYQGGELDIVAKDGETVVFVEEQKKIWKTACHFLHTQKVVAPKGFDQPSRFDVLSARVYQKPLHFSHIKNAFEGTQVIPQC